VFAPNKKAHNLFAKGAKDYSPELADKLGESFCLYMTVENADRVINEDPCKSLIYNMA